MESSEDRLGIDSHKINYHVARLNDWLHKKRTVYPIYVELSPTGACNHRCTFCALDYIGYKGHALDLSIIKDRISEMAQKGVRSIMFAGEGEPLLHKNLAEIIQHTKSSGIDVSLTTNASLLTEKFSRETLPLLSWIKTSFNAGTRETYALVHQTKPEEFDKVTANLAKAAMVKKELGSKCVLGTQMILLPENSSETVGFAKIMKEIGMDYVVIKPYSQHKKSVTHRYENIEYGKFYHLKEELEALGTDRFEVIFRLRTMEKLKEKECYYNKCQAVPHFWAYVMADGSVYGCSAYLKDERFLLGNLNTEDFTSIWEGEKRKRLMDLLERDIDITECRKNCRMDEVNRFLWDLKNPPDNINFVSTEDER